uniref:Protein-L-isoaspartate O-methyltransferase domain-containing protein 1 n=1 Tax=Meloidogyne hapla TaxID=6305 RepID=A0A1I8BZL4_MELHA
MGLVASIGKNNDELIDNLVDHDSIKNERVERIMRLVDRGKFMPEDAVDENAYKDSAWKSETGEPGFLHISAPCIYANVLEHLDLQKGMAFLNIGSGTGYLSTMAGFLLENVVNFATERISVFQSSPEACAFEWCPPTYFIGNAFQIQQNNKYDRIYCGALVPESHRAYFCSILKENGILVMPYGHSLQRIVRKSEKLFKTRDLSAVTFSHLIPVNLEDNSISNRPILLPQFEPNSLQFICRNKIRQLIRQKLLSDQPVEIHSLYAEKLAKKANNNVNNNKRHRSISLTRSGRLRRRIPRFDPVVVLDRDINNRAASIENGDNELIPNRPPPHAAQFRHLFALFARDRIRRHHEAHARQAAGNVLVINSDSDESDDEEIQVVSHNNNRQQQQKLYSGPDDESYVRNFIFESENEANEDDENVVDETVDEIERIDGGVDFSSSSGEDDDDDEEDNKTPRTRKIPKDKRPKKYKIEKNEYGVDEVCTDNEENENEENNSNESFETARDYSPILFNKKSKNNEEIENNEEEEDDLMEVEKVENLEEEKSNNSNNTSPPKNGGKRLRSCTSNSLEMPQSSKIKRRLSNTQQQQGGGGPSTSSAIINENPTPSQSLNETANYLAARTEELTNSLNAAKESLDNLRTHVSEIAERQTILMEGSNELAAVQRSLLNSARFVTAATQTATAGISKIKSVNIGKNGTNNKNNNGNDGEGCCSSSSDNNSQEDENAKLNETKAKEKIEKLSAFQANFIEAIQSLPINIQMRKFLYYENA